jgi:hypothetical protein
VKITECGDIEFYSKDKLQYFTVENVINRCRHDCVRREIADMVEKERTREKNVVSQTKTIQFVKD